MPLRRFFGITFVFLMMMSHLETFMHRKTWSAPNCGLRAGQSITAIPSNFATAAGGNQNISVFDELWAFTSERSRRLWDELVPPPTRQIACRLTTTYAGYEGESLLSTICTGAGCSSHRSATNFMPATAF